MNFLLAILLTAKLQPTIEEQKYVSCDSFSDTQDPLVYCEMLTLKNPLKTPVRILIQCGQDQGEVELPAMTRMHALVEVQIPSQLDPCSIVSWRTK